LVGSNGSDNFDVIFEDGRRKGLANCHPNWRIKYFDSDGKLIALSDLFSDAGAALDALSREARRQLEGRFDAKLHETLPEKDQGGALKAMHDWVERGTEAKAENFAVFLVDGLDAKAIGLTLIFAPYQVASYADGTQQVEVPAKVFYKLLKPEYSDAFQIDTEAEKLAPGVR